MTHVYPVVPSSGDFILNLERSLDISPALAVTSSPFLYHLIVGFGLPPASQIRVVGGSFENVTSSLILSRSKKYGAKNKNKNFKTSR